MALLKRRKGDLQPVIIKKVEGGHGGADHDESNWLVSYADMMTLLCGFFIMMFSMAKLDVPKYDSFKEAVSKQFGGEYVSPSKETAKFATQILQEMGVSQESIVYADGLGTAIAFESTIFFETGTADVKPQGKKVLEGLVAAFAKRQDETKKRYKIVVEGHTDGRPIIGGVYPSNWELSSARASRVVRMFLDKGYEPSDLVAIGYADTHPWINARQPDGTVNEELMAKNRRVVLRVLEPGNDDIPFPIDPNNPYVKKISQAGQAAVVPAAPAPRTVPGADGQAPSAAPAQSLSQIK